MKTNMEKFPAINQNPVLSVDKDGVVLCSNKASELLLEEWGVEVGEKLPTHVGNIVCRVISLKNPEKMEIKVGKRVYLVVFNPLPEKECACISGFDINYQKKLDQRLLHVLNEKLEANSRELRKLNEALINSESKYWHIVENSNDGIWILDRHDRTVFVNQKVSEMLGYSSYEIYGHSPKKFLAPKFRFLVDDRLRKYLQKVEKFNDYQFIRKDGSDLWCIVSTHQLFDDDGKYNGSLGLLIDTTERKKAEEALKESCDILDDRVKKRTLELEKAFASLKGSEERLTEAQKLAHVGSYDWNIASNEEYWSDELYRIFGFDHQSELNHNTFLNFIHPEDLELVSSAINEALNGKPYYIDYRIILPDGEERVIYSQGGAIYDEKNEPVRMRGIVQDITERKRAEEKIHHLANIVESSSDAIGTLSLDGIVTSWNKAAEQIYGYSAEEILEKPSSIVAPSHLREETKELGKLIKQGENVHHYETLRIRKDGKNINVSITLSPVLDSQGKLTAISFISRDITQRKNQEQEREMSMKFLQIMNACKGTRDLVHSVVSFFREFYGFEAVGIRFREDLDYPYFEASGFPEKFVLLENSLCTFDDSGKPLRDSSGYPIHECMCGNVINGRFDPSMPFFTMRGSFWTNCTTELLATTSEADRQARTRNRCNGEGYESVALISLHMGEERIGLIQLNDKRSGMFTLEMIKFFERLTDYLVVALTKTRTDEILRETYGKLHEQSKELELAYSSLKESEKRLAEAQRMAHVGNMEWNLVTGEIYWSEELYRIFSCSPQESCLTYDKFLNYVHPDDREYVILGAKKALSGEPVAGNYTIVLTDGEERKLHTNSEVIFDERNAPIRMRGTFQDITELTKAEEKLRESEEKYRNIVETANEGIVRTNNESVLTYVNKKMFDMLGYTLEEVLGKKIWCFISDEYIPIIKLNLERKKQGISEGGDLKLIHKDGSCLWVHMNSKPLFDPEGKYMGAVSMITDITRRKEAEKALSEMKKSRKRGNSSLNLK